MQRLFRIAGFDTLVTGVYLCPSLLEQHNPKLASNCFGEGRTVVEIRHVLVHIDGQPLALVEHSDGEVVQLIFLLEKEQVVNTVGSLSKRCQACQEVTISEIALLDVLWLWLSFEDDSLGILFEDLDPLDVLPFFHCSPFSAQGVDIGREAVVQKLLPFLPQLIELSFCRTGLDLGDLLLDELDNIECFRGSK